ncbi:hypothetical protein [Streptomyces sp. NPDC102487]|uniref:hypothetical protein n=1 Tax=Streptomyces sp. NPDC102487 TaxID=3366182 RepID=UPI0037F6F2AA
MAEPIHAPWTSKQVAALNAFQQRGGIHPFTCNREVHPAPLVLLAHRDGWHCSEPACDYRQDWAHAFMADPSAWPAVPVAGSPPATRMTTCGCGHSPDPGICRVEHNGYKAGGHCVCAHDGKPVSVTAGTGLRGLFVETLTSYFANFSDEESARLNAGEAAGAVLVSLLGALPASIDVPSWTAIRAIQLMNEAGRQTEAYRLALSQALGLGTGAPWNAIRERASELRTQLEQAHDLLGVANQTSNTAETERACAVTALATAHVATLTDAATQLAKRCPHLGHLGSTSPLAKCVCPAAEELLRMAAEYPGAPDFETARQTLINGALPAHADEAKHQCHHCSDPITGLGLTHFGAPGGPHYHVDRDACRVAGGLSASRLDEEPTS